MGIQQALFAVSAVNVGTVLSSGSGTWSIADVQYGSIESSAGIVFTSNGTVTYNGNLPPGPASNWNSPTSTGVGNFWWMRATVTAGSLSQGTTGSWLSLGTNRDYVVTATGGTSAGATITVEFASDSGGSNIVATHTNITLQATSNTGPIP